MQVIKAYTDPDGKQMEVRLDVLPDKCAVCSKHGRPELVGLSWFHEQTRRPLHVAFRCPVHDCGGMFVATYVHSSTNGGVFSFRLQGTALPRFVERKSFPRNIETLSPNFCSTFNQSLNAEQNGLDQICGPGYRKALEFLVKDFLIKHAYKDNAEIQERIRKTFLGKVIDDHIDQSVIRQCAKRAAWLGNDETHYARVWAGKDISDLKSLIQITLNHIDMTIEAEHYLAEMPDQSKPPTSPSPVEKVVS